MEIDLIQILGLNPLEVVIITIATMGLTELIKFISKHQWTKAFTVILSSAGGFILGFCLGINPLYGLVYGLASSGILTVVSEVKK